MQNRVAVTDPVYPVYIDTNVMGGRAGNIAKDGQHWDNIIYIPCTSENNFIPEPPSVRPDIIYLCYPNNPTGNLIPEDILDNILDICRDRNIVVVADECFIRFNPQYEIISCKRFLEDYDNLVIINAFTKFYAMAGIRLGYMMSANTELINRVSLQLPEWNVLIRGQRLQYNQGQYVSHKE